MLRAALWHWQGDLRAATRITAGIGGTFGLVLIALGVMSLLTGNFIAGFWWAVLGLFLRGAAAASYQQVLIRRALEGEVVGRFMTPQAVVVEQGLSIRRLIDEYFYRHYHKMYPVTADGRLLGCVTSEQLKQVPREQWDRLTVGDVVQPCSDDNTIRPDADAMEALSKLQRSGVSRLMVVDEGRLVGILSLKDLMQFLSLKVELESR